MKAGPQEARDEPSRESLIGLRERIAAGAGGVFHFPIRHHSPACALHLARALDEIAPKTLVLEMPADFAALVPLVVDPATRPPVAIVSIVEAARKDDDPAVSGFWPISACSPEWVALRHATAHGLRIVLADLPSAARIEAEAPDPDKAEGDTAPAGAPIVLTGERPIAYSDYARALVRRLGARDFNEVWDRLFESRAGEADWRAFFADLGVHCALARAATGAEAMARDLLPAREAHMRDALRTAIADAAGAPVAVVTGGFHTPALFDLEAASDPRKTPAAVASKAYLVRYGQRHLDMLNGYAAGMPSPRYYERLHAAVAAGAPAPFMVVAEDVLVALSARLRATKPDFAPSLPALVAALAQARGLAALRDLAGPCRAELLDAARSCFVKDEDVRFASPLLETLVDELTGDSIGDVPASAGSPPLVEAARARARAHGFRIDDGIERKRALDIHRKPRHRAASRFLHAMALLETGFARKVQGPDFRHNVNTAALFEVWTCAWSPLVEARLVALAADGDTVERVAAGVLRRRAEALEADGAARESSAVAALVTLAAQAGLAAAAGEMLARLGRTIALDPEFARLVDCFGRLDLLWRGRAVLGLADTPVLAPLIAACYRRAVDLLPRIAAAQGDTMVANARALAALHHLVEGAEAEAFHREGAASFDRELLDEAVAALLSADLPPLVGGVVASLAHLSGRLGADGLAATICGALAGAGAAPADRSAPLTGLVMVQPALLRHSAPILAGIDTVFATLDEADFLEMLPDLRLALAALDPHETDDLAERVAEMKGLAAPLRHATSIATAAEAIENARRSQALRELMEADGLTVWFEDGPLMPRMTAARTDDGGTA